MPHIFREPENRAPSGGLKSFRALVVWFFSYGLASRTLYRHERRGAHHSRLRARRRPGDASRTHQGGGHFARRHLRPFRRTRRGTLRPHGAGARALLHPRLRPHALHLLRGAAGGALLLLVLQERGTRSEPPHRHDRPPRDRRDGRALVPPEGLGLASADAGRPLRGGHEHPGPRRHAGGARSSSL